jgi:hypothetical protein
MAASKISIYNAALGHLGERKLSSLTENREPRRVLDDYYADIIGLCLEKHPWKFAVRHSEISASASVTPDFGFNNAFAKPDDWIRSIKFSADSTFSGSPLRMSEELDYWYADCDPLYVMYVSNSATLGGMRLGKWSEAFEEYVTLRLAMAIAPRITGNKADIDLLMKRAKRAFNEAVAVDRSGSSPEEPPVGTWAQSRSGTSRLSRWNRQDF